MRRATWLALFLLGCSEPAPPPGYDPSQPRRLDPSLLKNAHDTGAPPKPRDAVAAADAGVPRPDAGRVLSPMEEAAARWQPWSDAPKPEPLSGEFQLSVGGSNGLSMYSNSTRVVGSASGARVEQVVGPSRRSRDSNGEFFRGRLSAEKSRALLAELERLRFWAVNSAHAMVMDATGYQVSIRWGSVQHEFDYYGGCPCGVHRPTEPAPRCECPQAELVALIANARSDAVADPSPTTRVIAFKPAVTKVVKVNGSCSSEGRRGRFSCVGTPDEKGSRKAPRNVFDSERFESCSLSSEHQLTCFKSPFDGAKYVVSVKEKPDEPQWAKDGAASPWAIQLAHDRCVNTDREWKCDRATVLTGVLPWGKGWVALGANEELPVTAIWLR